jgi:hypothetical protein
MTHTSLCISSNFCILSTHRVTRGLLYVQVTQDLLYDTHCIRCYKQALMNSAQPQVYGNQYEHTEGPALKNGANFFHMPAPTIYNKYLRQTKKFHK